MLQTLQIVECNLFQFWFVLYISWKTFRFELQYNMKCEILLETQLSKCEQHSPVFSLNGCFSPFIQRQFHFLCVCAQELVGQMDNYPDIDISPPENEANDDFMFPDDLEDLDSDVESELLEDTISIISTPKPSLRFVKNRTIRMHSNYGCS